MDDTTPATKGDLQRLEQRIDRRFDRMHEDIDRILNMLVNTKHTTDDHEERIVALEAAIAA